MSDTTPSADRPQGEVRPLSRRERWRRTRRKIFGEPALLDFYGPAQLGPGRNATPEEWARFREEMLNPRPKKPSPPPPGYKFVWYTDASGVRHRAAVRDHGDAQPAEDAAQG